MSNDETRNTSADSASADAGAGTGSGDEFFGYKFDNRFKPVFWLLGVKHTDGVTLTADGRLVATYGRWKVDTPLSNVEHATVGGRCRWYTAIGLRLSFVDSGLTMGTNYERGVCICFVKPIPKVIGRKDHAGLWVSVDDCKGLVAAIDARMLTS